MKHLVASLLGALLILGAATPTVASSADGHSLSSYHGGSGEGGGGSGSDAPPGTVVIRDRAFNPNNINARVGEAVLWKWEDGDVAHTVTADDGSFDSGEKTTGEFRRTFDRPGAYSYHCENHPEMTGTVKVGG